MSGFSFNSDGNIIYDGCAFTKSSLGQTPEGPRREVLDQLLPPPDKPGGCREKARLALSRANL